MSYLEYEIRRGAYADSIVLMQLQGALAKLDGVEDAGVVMATAANRELLAANGLEPQGELAAGPDDLLIVVRGSSGAAAKAALAELDGLMKRDTSADSSTFRPKSLRSALASHPDARWVLVSVPGRYAAGVAREAIAAKRHVFLYSDNVSIEDEVDLKARAADQSVLVMGPDCGTATIGGAGMGFANRVRRGAIGIVAASGTGLQAVASRIDALGAGVSHAIGTGGRDLSRAVGGATALQALDLLARDPATTVIVLVSKPPAPEVAAGVLAAARATGKPVVVALSGAMPPLEGVGGLRFAPSLRRAANLAVELAAGDNDRLRKAQRGGRGFVRGLFSGGTLALEATQALRFFLTPLSSNLKVDGVDAARAEASGHSILDLGADEFTVGRPHPMIDADLRLRMLAREASDPEVGLIVLDLVLGDGAHADPAAELEPAIRSALERRGLTIGVLVVGTESDPQDLSAQIERLEAAGAKVVRTTDELVELAVTAASTPAPTSANGTVVLEDLDAVSAINVGLEHFHDSLAGQELPVVHVEWRPPAGGNAKLQAILAKMR